MNVRLVLHADNRGWILEKFATRLAEHLPAYGAHADISDVPSTSADVNHWLLYLYYEHPSGGLDTALVTHIDNVPKLLRLRAAVRSLRAAICLSAEMVETLSRRGIEAEKLCHVVPGHDGLVPSRRIVVGITSRAYADGRKREWLLTRLAEQMRLDAFRFEIIGDGWEPLLPPLKTAGAEVTYHPGSADYAADYAYTLERIRAFDYYLYTGMDEGSMGFLDALSAGVATIVTPQGFHLDVPGGITYPFVEFEELLAVFKRLARERDDRIASVANLTWAHYAEEHARIWQAVLAGQPLPRPQAPAAGAAVPGRRGRSRLKEDVRFFSGPIVERLKRLRRP
jgi:hypothetical protein